METSMAMEKKLQPEDDGSDPKTMDGEPTIRTKQHQE
jgi:hypothetical protein